MLAPDRRVIPWLACLAIGAMGIPGSVIDAILLGAFVIHGLQPGRMLMSQNPAAVHTMIGAVLMANLIMFAVMTFAAGWMARLSRLPRWCLTPVILTFCVVGSYSFANRVFDVWVMLAFGVFGYAIERRRIPLAPWVIGFVLAPIAESGYDCGLVGKFHLQSAGRRTEPRLDDGFGYWKFSHAPRDDWAEGHDYADWVKAKGGDLDAMREDEARVPPEFHQTTWASDRAIEFLRRPRPAGQPWLLNVHVYDPHFTGGTGTFGTMYRTPRFKLCLYHNKGLGELYDMENDPWEFDDLWDDPGHEAIKHRLIREAFDAHVVLTTDMGSRRISPM